MSLDDPTSWKAAAALERGENPAGALLPETKAASRLASAIGSYLDPKWLTQAALEAICAKAVAHRGFFRTVFDELDADPKRLPDRGTVLRQQQTAHLDDVSWWDEHCGHLQRELDDALAIRARVRAKHVSDYDRDDVAADEDSRRIAQGLRDDAAVDAAPRGIAS